MTREQFAKLAQAIDPINAEYIAQDPVLLHDVDWSEKSAHKKLCESDIEKRIKEWGEIRLSPASVKVGDGVTVCLYSDRHAGTIVKVTKSTITIRQDKAIRDPSFKPEWVPGGFSAICLNQNDQKWNYEPDEHGTIRTLHWSRKHCRFGTSENPVAIKGRHEYYDYNF
jgi:hypothetical protein